MPPPFRLKWRLHQASKRLRGFVKGAPGGWKRPWFTSEKWSQRFFAGGKLSKPFKEAYADAELTPPGTVYDDDD